MSDRTQFIVELSVLIFMGVISIIVALWIHYRELRRIRASIENLPPNPEGTERILAEIRVEGRNNLLETTGIRNDLHRIGQDVQDSMMDGMRDREAARVDREEARLQRTIMGQRWTWLVGHFDELVRWIKSKFNETPRP